MGKTKKGGGEGDDEPVKYRNLILQCMGTKKSIRRERLQTKVVAMVVAQMGLDEVSDNKRAKMERKFSKKLTGLIQTYGLLTETDGKLRRVASTEAAAPEEAEAAAGAKTAEETQSATAPAAKKRKRKAEAAEGSGGKSGAKQAKQTKERATAMRDIAGSDAEEEEEDEDVKARVQSKGQRGPWYNHADTSVERKMGKFSDEEKAKVMAAIEKEMGSHGQEKDDYTWLFKTKNKNKDKKSKTGNQYLQFWSAVGAEFSNRTPDQVYQFAKKHCLHLNNAHTWTDDDRAELIALVQVHGRKWTKISDLMGLSQFQVKNAYNTLNNGKTRNTGLWSEAEHALFEKAVERSLAHATPTTSGDASSDNISWVAVSQLVGTRSSAQCMNHWQNRSVRGKSMEARGLWADGDDEILVSAIEEAGATEEYEVQWDSLMTGREAPVVKRQWHLLVKKVPQWWNKSFAERLEALSAKMLRSVKAV